MQADSSRRHWIGMAVACAITLAAGIARTRLAQDAITPDAGNAASAWRENGHDRGTGAAVDHPVGGVPR